MVRLNTGITQTTYYGHYNAYAIYRMSGGSYKVYVHTFTDSTTYDHYKNDWSALRCEREALKLARTDDCPTTMSYPPSYAFLQRPYVGG